MRKIFEHISEEILWQRYRDSDEEAFNELFQRYYRKIVHYGLKFTQDRQLAEDCLQELMIRLWTKRRIVGDTESVRHYLFKAYRHILFRKIKQLKTLPLESEGFDLPDPYLSAEESLIRHEADSQLKSSVNRLLRDLTPRQREILYLRFYQNLTPPEIGSLLSINAQSVSNIIQRAFIKIRETAPRHAYDSLISLLAGILFFFF